MRLNPLLPVAALVFTGSLPAQTPAGTMDQTLRSVRDAIDTHAVTHHDEPPSRSGGVKWQVNKLDGCSVELKETDHRESKDSIANHDGVFSLNEDRVVTWTFDLGEIHPEFVMADSSAGTPHIKIFAEGDAFHTKTETVSRAVRKDGSVESTQSWSAAGNVRNLLMYFDSPAVDNKALVHRLEADLREAVYRCGVRASTR
jgi:hypothetical protein